jgi:hypothetical protein
MTWHRAVNLAVVVTAGLFLFGSAFIVIKGLVGSDPIATAAVQDPLTGKRVFGGPALAIPRGGVRVVEVTTADPRTPLALKARSASGPEITLSAEGNGVLRPSRPEVAPFGREVTLPIGRLPIGTSQISVYAKSVPTAKGPPIILEEVRVAWDAQPTLVSTVIVWTVLITGPLFLMLLIIRFAIGPTPDPSGD